MHAYHRKNGCFAFGSLHNHTRGLKNVRVETVCTCGTWDTSENPKNEIQCNFVCSGEKLLGQGYG
jgi:hypothetical protein